MIGKLQEQSKAFEIMKGIFLTLYPIVHLLLFLSPDWLPFCHMIISLI